MGPSAPASGHAPAVFNPERGTAVATYRVTEHDRFLRHAAAGNALSDGEKRPDPETGEKIGAAQCPKLSANQRNSPPAGAGGPGRGWSVHPRSLDEQHLAVGRQRPEVVGELAY
jgi:hypothetical protein